MKNNKKEDDFDRKEFRRQKINKKVAKPSKKDLFDDESSKKNIVNQEKKRIKQEIDDEEWENWERFYNR